MQHGRFLDGRWHQQVGWATAWTQDLNCLLPVFNQVWKQTVMHLFIMHLAQCMFDLFSQAQCMTKRMLGKKQLLKRLHCLHLLLASVSECIW